MKTQLDARHLLCPMPVIRTQQKVSELADGDELEVLASDPGALHDIPAWCRIHGHTVLDCDQHNRQIAIRLRVCKPQTD